MFYKIFMTVNREFGEIEGIVRDNKDVANIIWKSLMSTGCPIITVKENSFKVWNAPCIGQPPKLEDHEWPEWAKKEWSNRKTNDNTYLGAALYDWRNIGCFELCHKYLSDAGLKKIVRTFWTYRGVKLFSVVEYD